MRRLRHSRSDSNVPRDKLSPMTSWKKSTHYEAEQWIDFVRAVGRDTDRDRMQAHLQTGCKKCRKMVDLYKRVSACAAADGQYRVPQALLQRALNIFAQAEPYDVVNLNRRGRKAA